MIRVCGNNIEMTRGDTFRAEVNIVNVNGEPYVLGEEDIVTFTMKKTYDTEAIVLQKVISNESRLLEIKPSDTKDLKMPSDYVYDIQLERPDGSVDTFIAKATLKITEEVG